MGQWLGGSNFRLAPSLSFSWICLLIYVLNFKVMKFFRNFLQSVCFLEENFSKLFCVFHKIFQANDSIENCTWIQLSLIIFVGASSEVPRNFEHILKILLLTVLWQFSFLLNSSLIKVWDPFGLDQKNEWRCWASLCLHTTDNYALDELQTGKFTFKKCWGELESVSFVLINHLQWIHFSPNRIVV